MPHCRIFLDQPLATGSVVTIAADQAHYLRHVMRLLSGDPITIFNGQGGEYSATVDHLSKQGGSCYIESFNDVDREMATRVHIIQCANKSDKIETVLQKCTELGAAGFQITNSERSQFKLTDKKHDARLERWRKIIIEAAEQSGRTTIPTIRWQPLLQSIKTSGTAYVLHPESATEWRDARSELIAASEITLAIGPEGGWSRRDLDALEGLNFNALAFSPRIMRCETAAPALLAAIEAVLST